jgi:mannose-6-phosphate isomerase-like protein (cupin superfamily)
MMTGKEYINSGVLELYVLGQTSPAETNEVEMMAAADELVRQEIESITHSLEAYAMAHAVVPNPVIKPFLLATVDYTERLKNGEPVTNPPVLNENSTVDEFADWLKRPDMVADDSTGLFAKIIGYSVEAITAVVWIRDYAPQEVHDHEYEKFLIVEGTCDIIVGEEVNQLVAGDYFAIPLHKTHMVKVTSSIPCKVILQRIAA